MIKQCDICNGRKKMKGLGLIEKDCYECNGAGWIEYEDNKIEAAHNLNGTEVEIKVKRGRKKRVIEDGDS